MTAFGLPAISLPSIYPDGNPVAQILRIGVDPYLTGFFEHLEGFDYCLHFHSVVRGLPLEAGNLLLGSLIAQNSGPSARPGVARTSAIGINVNSLERSRTRDVFRPIGRYFYYLLLKIPQPINPKSDKPEPKKQVTKSAKETRRTRNNPLKEN